MTPENSSEKKNIKKFSSLEEKPPYVDDDDINNLLIWIYWPLPNRPLISIKFELSRLFATNAPLLHLLETWENRVYRSGTSVNPFMTEADII